MKIAVQIEIGDNLVRIAGDTAGDPRRLYEVLDSALRSCDGFMFDPPCAVLTAIRCLNLMTDVGKTTDIASASDIQRLRDLADSLVPWDRPEAKP